MAQISRHKLIAPVCKVGSLCVCGAGGPWCPEGSQLSGRWVVPTHILPDSLRSPCYIQGGVGLLLVVGWTLSPSVVSWAEGLIQDGMLP